MADNHAKWLLSTQVSGGGAPGYCSPVNESGFNSFTAASVTYLSKYNLTSTYSYN